ncbi:protein ImuB [Tamaricihabitans halophyticus]|uniref:Protein ImuB n=1 Tax=Tamaricihabitans halophyticus TaxID=1262583 RepID=A0A4V2ST50_9PSEU|nr:DNA polymerase Y family protein [Tamaricihabitans halophyticus]TCP49386.1 protein ImuB [Tamaricihabitans halophyticus]
MSAPRLLVVWCPDWPVVAAGQATGVPVHIPAAVLSANRVLACSAQARGNGIRRGMRRRQAQGRCPELVVFDDDPARDAALFEPVAAAVEELAVGVEVIRSGVVAVPARGSARYFGGERDLAERLIDQLASSTGVECQIGIADGLFAALLAAHRSVVVAEGASAEFLAPLSVSELDQPGIAGQGCAELIDLLNRLGLSTLGEFAEIPEREVAARFGTEGVRAHRLANATQERPLDRRRPPPDLSITQHLDPPVERVDAAAFVARGLAERLHAGLASRGFACTRLNITASTEHGEQFSRMWRCAEPLTPAGIADRVRWQLDGWLRIGKGDRPSSGIQTLHLEPAEVVLGSELQLGLWHGAEQAAAAERAGRALVRVQGLLGEQSAGTPVVQGGRGPTERVRLVPWGTERSVRDDPELPWPGRLPSPSPATVLVTPEPAVLRDTGGAEIELTARGELSAAPHVVRSGWVTGLVSDWAGPWLVDQRWWAPERAALLARVQVVLTEEETGTQTALLLLRAEHDSPQWMVEGVYD